MSNKPNILFCGASGYGNLGDDAYKNVFSEYLSNKFNLCFDSPYPDVRYIPFIDHLVIGGGGVIYNNSTAHFAYMKMYMDEAIKYNKPIYFLSCGVQLVDYRRGLNPVDLGVKQLEVWKPYLDNAKLITVRSEMDKTILQKVSTNENIFYAPDLVHLLKPVDYHLTLLDTPVFIITKSSSNNKKFKAYMDKYKDSFFYVLCLSKDDEVICGEYASLKNPLGNYVLRTNLTPQEACRIIADASEVISGRYHGVIMARAVGKNEKNIICTDERYKSIYEVPPVNPADAQHTIKLFLERI